MNHITKTLRKLGYELLLVGFDNKHDGHKYYQLQKDDVIYPLPDSGQKAIRQTDIENAYNKGSLYDVVSLFKAPWTSTLPTYTQKAKSAYRERNTSVTFTINVNSEADVLEWLNRQSNKSGAIKSLIRQAAAREKHQ